MNKQPKYPYQQPTLKVVCFRIERGFVDSPTPAQQSSNFEAMVPNDRNDEANNIYSSLTGNHFQ